MKEKWGIVINLSRNGKESSKNNINVEKERKKDHHSVVFMKMDHFWLVAA